jgi:hypothetical protein
MSQGTASPGSAVRAPVRPVPAPGVPDRAPGVPVRAPGIPGRAPETPASAPGVSALAPGRQPALPGFQSALPGARTGRNRQKAGKPGIQPKTLGFWPDSRAFGENPGFKLFDARFKANLGVWPHETWRPPLHLGSGHGRRPSPKAACRFAHPGEWYSTTCCFLRTGACYSTKLSAIKTLGHKPTVLFVI